METLYQKAQIELQMQDLWFTLGLMVALIGLSWQQRLRLEGSLIIATGRALLQLAVLGYVLDLGFSVNHPAGTLGVLSLLTLLAAIVIQNRLTIKLPLLGIVTGLWLLMLAIVGYGVLIVVRPDTWYAPQYWIPLGGMVLGTALNTGVATGESLISQIKNHRLEIETHLSLGATPRQALQRFRDQAVRTGVLPTVNGMAIVGLATLPTFLSGQLLSGVAPLVAVVYELLLLILLSASTLITALLVIWGIERCCFNTAAQLVA
jgi:putative ABC transport system permease protein